MTKKLIVLVSLVTWIGFSSMVLAVDEPPASATLVGEWSVKTAAPSAPGGESPAFMKGVGRVLLQGLTEGDYVIRIEPADPTSAFPVLLPGGVKENVTASAGDQTGILSQEFEFKVGGTGEAIFLGGRVTPASWSAVEIEKKDHTFKAKFVATDYQKPPLPPPFTLSPERVKEIAAMLSENPAAMGPNIEDRAAWAAFAERNPGNHFIEHAEVALKEPTPALPDDLFLVYKNKGTRYEYEGPFEARRRRLGDLVIAECLTDKGRYLDAIQKELEAILSEKTWVLPAHDTDLANFNGKIVNIDLGVSVRGLVVATAYSWLGDKLPQPLRDKIVANLKTRVLEPYLKRLRHEDDTLCWWANVNSNWNAVCHAGVVGTALAILPSPTERAEFVAGAEAYTPYFLLSLAKDGYSDEGLGYWNYGFGHYVLLAETVLKATNGKVNLYDREMVRKTTNFPPGLEMQPGVYPAFGDCAFDMKPFTWVKNISEFRVYGREPSTLKSVETADNPIGGTLYETAVAGFPLFVDPIVPVANDAKGETHLRNWFSSSEVLISRPGDQTANGLSVAIKGGINQGTHFHLDLGEFLVSVNGTMLLVDPGLEPYGRANEKYQHEMVNSFGHSVPIVAGKGQKVGKDAEAKVLMTQFTADQDEMEFDLGSAYDVPSLQKLTRTYVYSRSGQGSLEVTDDVAFKQPEDFGGSLITYGKPTITSPTSAVITQGDASVVVDVSAGVPLHLEIETVKTTNKVPPTRLRVVLEKQVEQAEVKYLVRPKP